MSDIKVTIGGDAGEFARVMAGVKKEGMSLGKALRVPIAGAGLAGIGLAAKSLIDELDNIGDEADKLGVSTKFFQEIGNAAKVSGASVEDVSKAAKNLAVNIADAKDGDKVSKSLAAIGLSSKDLIALPVDQKFKAVADAISKQSDQSVKLNAANDLLGKSGKELIPTLEALGKNNGQVFSDESIRNAQKFNDWITITTNNLKVNFVKGVELAKDAMSGKLFTDPLNKEGKAAEAKKTKDDEAAAIAAGKAKAAQAEADAKEKADGLVDKGLKKIQLETELQEKKNAGKEREAEIQKQIADLEEKTGRALTDDQRAKVTDAASKLYGAKQPQVAEVSLPSRAGFTSLREMGANLAGNGNAEGRNLDKERNELLKKIAENGVKNLTNWDAKHMTEIQG